MARSGGTMLGLTIQRLTDAFGEPVCRGDCCWWTLSRLGSKPVRLSVFLDSDPERPAGWLCDLQNPSTAIERFTVTDEGQLEMVVGRVRAFVGEQEAANSQMADRK